MKIQSPWMGRIKGSAGNMTGCKVYDKNVMRAKAFEVNNPNTAAQQVQRGYFAELTSLVASFTPDQLRTLFPSKPKAMSRRNALSKQLAEYNTMSGTEKIVDYENIDTIGNAPTCKIELYEPDFSEQGVVSAGQVWPDDILAQYPNHRQVVVLINNTKKEIHFSNHSCLIDETDNFPVPTSWETEDEITQIPLVTNQTNALGAFGSFIIKVRPEKKSN